MRLIVIARHGNTFAADEPPRRVGCRTDLPLVASGLAQAVELGKAARQCGWAFDQVLSGRLTRVQQTAAAIASRCHGQAVVETADWLDEIDHGPDEGQVEQSVVDRVGATALWRWDTDGTPPAGWLDRADERLQAWRTFLAAPGPRCAFVVTSNGAARYALLALPALHRPASLKLRTGAFGVLMRRQAGWRVVDWNIRPEEGRAADQQVLPF